MYDNKLLKLLATFSKEEMNQLSKFVQSPFYNTNPTQVRFLKLLKSAHPSFYQPKLKKERVFKKLFPGKAFNYAVLGNLVSGMYQLAEKCLLALYMEKEKTKRIQVMTEMYANRSRGYDLFLKKRQIQNKRLESRTYQEADWCWEKFKLQQLYFNHIKTPANKLKQSDFEESMRFLDNAYVLEKLLLSCEMKARERPFNEKYKITLLSEIKNNINELKLNDPILDVYILMLNLLEKEDESIYFKLKKVFNENVSLFSKRQQKNILQSLINFSIKKGNSGSELFLKENLELYKLGLNIDLFLEHGILNDFKYISIAIIAIKNKEHEWCDLFLKKYGTYLNDTVKNDAKAMGMGLLLFDRQESSKAIELINQVEFKNNFYQNQARVLLLKSYFEEFIKNENYYDLIIYNANSFERSLKRNKKISDVRKTGLLNFVWAVKKMAELLYENKFIKTEKVKSEILERNPMAGKLWLLKKMGM